MSSLYTLQASAVDSLSAFSKFKLAQTPTPLHRLDRLTEALGGPTIWIKREDATGLALGGNKVRKLEYHLGKAVKEGYKTLVTVGAFQSNHVRQTAAAAAVAGLPCEAVLVDAVAIDTWNYTDSGNVMLDELLGATVHRVRKSISPQLYIAKLLASLQLKGRKPLFIPVGGSNALGSLGHVELASELLGQKRDIDAIYLASSSGGTQSGLLAGLALEGATVSVQGINVYAADTDRYAKSVRRLTDKVLKRAGVSERIASEQVLLDGAYRGAGYGIATDACLEAVRLLASLEAIFLDPVYTGKAMAALIADVKAGRYRKDQQVVFIHTGGAPSLFAYAEAFATPRDYCT